MPVDQNYANLLGATFQAVGLVASFPMSVLDEGNEVRLVYDSLACSDWKGKASMECPVGLKLKDVR